MDEMTINFRDMFYKVVIKWRLILVWMLIGGVVFGSIGYLKSFRYVESVKQTLNKEDEIDWNERFKTLRQKLSDRELSEVDDFAETYKVYRKYLKNSLSYNLKSIKMQLNPSAVPTLTAEYYIDCNYETVYPVISKNDLSNEIAASYVEKINNQSVGEQIIEELNWDTEEAYVQELINACVINSSQNIFRVSVIAPDQVSCETIMRILSELITDTTQEFEDIYGDFTINELSKQFSVEANPELLTFQQSQASNTNNVKYTITNVISGLNDAQKEYYYALLDYDLYTNDDTIDNLDGTESDEFSETDLPTVDIFNIKYILFGMIIGVCIICAYIILRYLLSPTLRVKDDIQGVYGVPVLGCLNMNNSFSKIFSFIDRLIYSLFKPKDARFTEEEQKRMICAGIRITAQKEKLNKIFITGTCCGNDIEEVKNTLCEELKNENSSVISGKSVIYDPESLENMVGSDGVVFIEKIASSFYSDMKKQVELCREHNIRIIGCIVLS